MAVYIICILTFASGIAISFLQIMPKIYQQGAVFVWGAGLVLLGYGLIRDLILIFQKHEEGEAETSQERMAVICLESTTGLLVVFLGLALHYFGWTQPVTVSLGSILIVSSVIVAGGHYTRDWVLILAKVTNHRSLIPAWNVNEKK